MVVMFDVDELIGACRDAVADGGPIAVREVVDRAMAARRDIQATFGEPTEAALTVLYAGPDLLVVNAVWSPRMTFPAHDHLTWGVIGMYAGQEDNHFYRRTANGIEPSVSRSIPAGEVVSLGPEVVHAVENPLTHGYTGGIHVYDGSYVDKPRTLWDPDTSEPGPATVAQSQAIFARANTSA